MVIRCPVCKKIKKFDKWIEVPKQLEEEIKETPVLSILCEDCRKEASCIANPIVTPIQREVCFGISPL